MKLVKKIAITGPESTGKSRLCNELAQHFNTVFVPEYARGYIGKLDRPYVERDLLEIAMGQVNLEKQMENQANKLFFCDTEMTVLKIWSLHRFCRCNQFLLQKLQEQNYDLILLCDVDLPWEPDEQREHPKHRKYFLDWFIIELNLLGANYRLVSGLGDDRLSNAIIEVNQLLYDLDSKPKTPSKLLS